MGAPWASRLRFDAIAATTLGSIQRKVSPFQHGAGRIRYQGSDTAHPMLAVIRRLSEHHRDVSIDMMASRNRSAAIRAPARSILRQDDEEFLSAQPTEETRARDGCCVRRWPRPSRPHRRSEWPNWSLIFLK